MAKPRIEAWYLGKKYVSCETRLNQCQADLKEFEGKSDRIKLVTNKLTDDFEESKKAKSPKSAEELNQWIRDQYSW